jgi:hypothetical protein
VAARHESAGHDGTEPQVVHGAGSSPRELRSAWRAGCACPAGRREPPDSGTAAELAFQIVVGNAVLCGPGLKLRATNRIGQRPRRLVSKFCPPSEMKQVDDALPAEFLWSHGYRQSLLVLSIPRP